MHDFSIGNIAVNLILNSQVKVKKQLFTDHVHDGLIRLS